MKRLRNVPWVSGMLVVINVIVFLMCTFSGNVLYNKGELDVVSVLAGKQYGRLLWAMFLHAGIEHIFNNMVLLFFLGAMIEKVTGHVTFLVLYFLSGIGGNLCSLLVKLLQMDYSASVGARSHLWTGRSTACLDFAGSAIYAGCDTQTGDSDDSIISVQWFYCTKY